MDFLYNFFQSDTFLWALIGIPSLLGFLILMRLMRAGRKSFHQRHAAMDARILQTTQEMEELNKNIQKSEHLHIIASALREAVLWPSPTLQNSDNLSPLPSAQVRIEEFPHEVHVKTPSSTYVIVYVEKKLHLQSTQKTLRGQGYFEVTQKHSLSTTPQEKSEIFYDLCTLEHYLLQKITTPQEYKGPPALRKKK